MKLRAIEELQLGDQTPGKMHTYGKLQHYTSTSILHIKSTGFIKKNAQISNSHIFVKSNGVRSLQEPVKYMPEYSFRYKTYVYKCSICARPESWQISIQYSNWAHTFASMSGVIAPDAVIILCSGTLKSNRVFLLHS